MKWLGGFFAAIVLPLLLSEFTDWCPWFAKRLVRRAAGYLPDDARARWEEEWLDHINTLANRRLSTLVRAIWIYVRAPSWGRMLQGLPPISHVLVGRIGALVKRLRQGQQPAIIHRRGHVPIPSGSLWFWTYADYQDRQTVAMRLTGERKANAFVLQESLHFAPDVEAVLYFPNPTCWPLLGTVCSIRVRQQDLPSLLRLVKRTQGLEPMSTEHWRLAVRW